jgi:RNA-directed DNA polymerase
VTRTPVGLQDLRRRIYVKAKAERTWRFWGLFVHVCKEETLREAYALAKKNDGAPGIDGVTFAAIEQGGVDVFIEQLRDELVTRRYRPMKNRRQEIPKSNGKVRVLGIPAIRDRVVQGALKLILEPIFEADFQPGSYGYRPRRTAHQAIHRVSDAIVRGRTHVIDVDLRAFFDNVQHHILLRKVAERVDDPEVMRLLKLMLKATGGKGVPQGGVISPLLSNIYLNDVDRMLERAKQVTRYRGKYGEGTPIEYARFADDLVILVGTLKHHEWLLRAVPRRLREELGALQVEINEEKSRIVDLAKGESFGFLGFDFRQVVSLAGRRRAQYTPKLKKRTELMRKVKGIFWRHESQPVEIVVRQINPILRGWVNYFAIGHSGRCFELVRHWVEQSVRRHLMRNSKRRGHGWKRWSSPWLYRTLGLFDGYHVRYVHGAKALPT